MCYYAHIRTGENGQKNYQTVKEHCLNTAAFAADTLESVGLYHAAFLTGLVHDAGKYKKEFQDYLFDGNGIRGSVNHTFAGCRMLLEHFHQEFPENLNYKDITSELLAYAAGAHHGLFDCLDQNGKNGFQYRLKKENIGYEESRNNFLRYCSDWTELETEFERAHEELMPIYNKLAASAEKCASLSENPNAGGTCMQFYIGQLQRLLLSAVIEADRKDTAEFMNASSGKVHAYDTAYIWGKSLEFMENKLSEFPNTSKIQRKRREISDRCREFAEREPGIYRLNVPTGGGKTLSSLRYALAHAKKWGKKRIIFVTPLLAILDQNAEILRRFIGNDDIILEHHSNVITTDDDGESLDYRELAVESWHAPIIITTLVQLLNTMFLGKTTSIRRYQALCDAVVVIDEVQTVPDNMLSMFDLTVNFLSEICHTTFLMCSATQPCFESAEYPLLFSHPADVIDAAPQLRKTFHRTSIINAGARKLDEIPAFIEHVMTKASSLLIICNKKQESEFLYHKLKDKTFRCFHLSAAMCMAHRRETLSQIEEALKKGERTVCVSTQVMEAGVDLSFECVIRLAAGMDSVVQAAGRCNRNGESPETAPVYIVQCTDENLGKLWDIQREKNVTIALLNEFNRNPEAFSSDLSSDESINYYYEKLYKEEKAQEGFQQYPVTPGGTLLSLLSDNEDYLDSDDQMYGRYYMNQSFRQAGAQFKVFNDETEDIVVPYAEGVKLIEELKRCQSAIAPDVLKQWCNRAKPYTVSVYRYQKEKLAGGLSSINGILVLSEEYYDLHTGLLTEPVSKFWEV